MHRTRVTVSWSGGKDSAFTLSKVLNDPRYDVINLHTIVDTETKRVGLHGIREELIKEQAKNLEIPLTFLYLNAGQAKEPYENLVKTFYKRCVLEGIEGIVFGDIFLEDLRQYRESLLNDSKLIPSYPLWGMDREALYKEFVNSGFKALICSANSSFFVKEQLGQTLNLSLLLEFLHMGIDVCGENGEFHTFVFNGPIFKKPIAYKLGNVVERNYSYQINRDVNVIESVITSFLFQDVMISV